MRCSGIEFLSMVIRYEYGWCSIILLVCQVCLPRIQHEVSKDTVLRIWNISQICINAITDNTPRSKSMKSGNWNKWKIRMVAIPLDKINNNKVSKYTNALIFHGILSQNQNVSYYLKIHWNCDFVGLLHQPFWLYLVLALLNITSRLYKLHCLAKDHWRGFSTRNAHMVHIVN